MNRDKALAITDLIFAVVADDPKNFNRDKIADLIQAGDALPEIVDTISHDDEKWVRRDGTAFDVEKSHERFLAEGFATGTKWTPDELMKIMSRALWEMPLPVNRIEPKKTA